MADAGALPDEPNSADLAALPFEALLAVPVVTSASRFAQSIADAPSAVVVLTAADIRDFGWRTLGDALASLPGTYVSYDRNYAYLGARGFLRPGDYDSRFLLLIDGYPTNDAVYGQAAIGTEMAIDMDLVERIEYVPGPGSAVYGSSAFFGVVNVITKNGSAVEGAQTSVALGSFGEKKARATYGWHGQNGADVLLSATSFVRNGQSLYFPEFHMPGESDGVARGLDYDRSQQFLAKGSFGGLTITAVHSNRTKGVPNASFGAVFGMPDSTTDTQSFVNASYEQPLSKDVNLAAQAYWGRWDYRGEGFYPLGDNPSALNVDGAHALWYGIGTHATIKSLTAQTIVIGAEFQRNARRDQYNYWLDPYVSALDDHHSSNRSAVYVEDEIQLPANFVLNAGLRHDRDSITGGNLNPRLALIYKATPRDSIKLIYGTAYRAPNAYEMYYAIPGDQGQEANPRLHSEHITTREVVFEHRLGATGRATMSLYQYTLRNVISQLTDPDTGALVFANVDHAAAKGAEWAIDNEFGHGWRLRASYSWQLAKDRATGATLDNSPRHLAKLNLVTPLFWQAARLGTELQCTSARKAGDSVAGGYCLANLTLSSSRLAPRTDVALSLYNAFNKRYSDPAGPAFVAPTVYQQSRTVYAKMTYGF